MSERTFQDKIVKTLKTIPDIWFYKSNDSFVEGLPDIIGCYNGRTFVIEVKSAIGRLSVKQQIMLSRIELSGGLVIVAKETKITVPEVVQEILAS
jgi:hypothetical protein